MALRTGYFHLGRMAGATIKPAVFRDRIQKTGIYSAISETSGKPGSSRSAEKPAGAPSCYLADGINRIISI
ncbi:MAG: hypothetical protein AB2L24_04795 [Mangrovibacterium sp.]